MNKLRESYFDALKASSRKQLVSKSATGPKIYCLRNSTGSIIGYAPGEQVAPAEIKRQIEKEEVAKSAQSGLGIADGLASELQEDPNSMFDASALLPKYDIQSFGVEEIAKSVNSDDDSLIGIFPAFLRPRK
ncbi:hypothetical protein [Blastopirellula marina]|uniref:Uncharacterized protein n=1 Tax=Blastopirellula marina DSM 3645 TaxID=314230 RepID=A3ZPR0_9BACT|nr:hypothetical protein [Blastopirellula marina]EAQ81738.1 hypothetical protein DSM3645_29192 [Blastopirellula marina DSM 3645]